MARSLLRPTEKSLSLDAICAFVSLRRMTEPTDSPILLPRRRLLGLVFTTGTGLLLGLGKADAMWNVMDVVRSVSGGDNPAPANEIPPALRGVLGSSSTAYAKFLSRLNLRRISVRQIIDSHAKARGNVHNTLPPRQLWGNIRSTLLVLDKVAARLGEPVGEVLSVYRSPAYNALCGGAKSNSYHVRNNAIDVRFNSSARKVAAAARDLRREGKFSGGVGRYPGFTHLDTRGSNADW
jgi:hypothetical protein